MTQTLRTLLEGDCCVCGSRRCDEASDHEKITIKDVKSFICGKKLNLPDLDFLKEKLKNFYQRIKTQLLLTLEEDEKQLQLFLNKFYFSYVDDTKVNLKILCQIAQNRFQRFPHKKLNRIIENLKNSQIENPQFEEENSSELNLLKKQISSFIQGFQTNSFTTQLKQHLPFKKTITKYLPSLQLKKSISQITIPEEIDEDSIKKYSWKNVTITNKNKTLALNNKKITDIDLMRQIPIISSFKNIREFEIRNNNLTKLSCKLIAINMTYLTELDIRGNMVGDEGVIRIVEELKNIKKLMISQTGITDRTGEAMLKNLQNMQMLWCEENRISGQMALKLGKKPKLRIMSLVKNDIHESYGEQLKKIFNSKGYVVI